MTFEPRDCAPFACHTAVGALVGMLGMLVAQHLVGTQLLLAVFLPAALAGYGMNRWTWDHALLAFWVGARESRGRVTRLVWIPAATWLAAHALWAETVPREFYWGLFVGVHFPGERRIAAWMTGVIVAAPFLGTIAYAVGAWLAQRGGNGRR